MSRRGALLAFKGRVFEAVSEERTWRGKPFSAS
jgi:hypothetical protein